VSAVELAHDDEGDGHPLLLIHAGVCDRRMWDAQWRRIARELASRWPDRVERLVLQCADLEVVDPGTELRAFAQEEDRALDHADSTVRSSGRHPETGGTENPAWPATRASGEASALAG
jgi:pimeloyl-ACP methyl ester carboxylesterase